MLAVVEPEKLDAAVAVCDKWGLRSTVIGTVTDTPAASSSGEGRPWSATCPRRSSLTTPPSTTRKPCVPPTSTRCKPPTFTTSEHPTGIGPLD